MKKSKLLKLLLPTCTILSLCSIVSFTSCKKDEPIVDNDCCVLSTLETCPVTFSLDESLIHEETIVPNFQYSIDDGKTWNEIILNQENNWTVNVIFSPRANVLIKGDNPTGLPNAYNSHGTRIKIEGKANLSGTIMSLLDNGTGTMEIIPSIRCFDSLFAGSKIVKVDKNFLPAKGLNHYCYANLFKSCPELIQAPDLPATNLEPYCYDNIFGWCSKLETAPELNAEYLEEGCYHRMFYECKLLKAAPVLNSVNLAKFCYDEMFYNCQSLVDIPDLPATNMEQGCYKQMFFGCTGLTDVDQNKLKDIEVLDIECFDGMFKNCENLVHPLLTIVKELAPQCYKDMYYGCAKMTLQPGYVLPAQRLNESCYEGMFSHCYSIEATPRIEAISYAPSCFENMFTKCTKLKTAMDSLPKAVLYTSSCSGMFSSCAALTKAPELPSTNLGAQIGAIECYANMFANCTSLTEAPDLPATDLSPFCYCNMIGGCTNIKSIKVAFTDWQLCWERHATDEWFTDASSGGTFICKQELINSATEEERFNSNYAVPADPEGSWKWTEQTYE